jgi:hypothetical protein
VDSGLSISERTRSSIQLGEKEGRKLRCAEKAPGKRNITRWFNAIVTGYDNETADKLKQGRHADPDRARWPSRSTSPQAAPLQGGDARGGRDALREDLPGREVADVLRQDDGDAAEGDGVSTTEEPSLIGTDDGGFDPLAGIA